MVTNTQSRHYTAQEKAIATARRRRRGTWRPARGPAGCSRHVRRGAGRTTVAGDGGGRSVLAEAEFTKVATFKIAQSVPYLRLLRLSQAVRASRDDRMR